MAREAIAKHTCPVPVQDPLGKQSFGQNDCFALRARNERLRFNLHTAGFPPGWCWHRAAGPGKGKDRGCSRCPAHCGSRRGHHPAQSKNAGAPPPGCRGCRNNCPGNRAASRLGQTPRSFRPENWPRSANCHPGSPCGCNRSRSGGPAGVGHPECAGSAKISNPPGGSDTRRQPPGPGSYPDRARQKYRSPGGGGPG